MAAARDGLRNREQIFQIQRRVPAGVVFAVAINRDLPGAFPEFSHPVERPDHFVLAPHDADEALHHFLQLVLHLIRPFGAAAGARAAIKRFERLPRGRFNLRVIDLSGAVFLRKFCGKFSGAFAEHNQIGK